MPPPCAPARSDWRSRVQARCQQPASNQEATTAAAAAMLRRRRRAASRRGGLPVRPVRVLWSQDVETQTRGYWAIGVALHRAGCEVVLGGAQTPAEVVEAATQEQVDVVAYRAMGEGAAARVQEVRAG